MKELGADHGVLHAANGAGTVPRNHDTVCETTPTLLEWSWYTSLVERFAHYADKRNFADEKYTKKTNPGSEQVLQTTPKISNTIEKNRG